MYLVELIQVKAQYKITQLFNILTGHKPIKYNQ